MQTHPKKRIEIIIEAPLRRRLIEQLERSSVTGYSVLPVLAGRGLDGEWSCDGQVGDAASMLAIVCITDLAKADEVLENVFSVVSRQIGVVSVSDVAVIRPNHF